MSERFRGHEWLKQHRQRLPKTWVMVRSDEHGEYFVGERKARPRGTNEAAVERQPCTSCGKGAGPGSGAAEIEAMLRGD